MAALFAAVWNVPARAVVSEAGDDGGPTEEPAHVRLLSPHMSSCDFSTHFKKRAWALRIRFQPYVADFNSSTEKVFSKGYVPTKPFQEKQNKDFSF